MKFRLLSLILFLVANVGIALATTEQTVTATPVVPLTNVHAHNDYEHTRPLLDALENGFCSVEADIYLVDGKLLVAHERKDVRPDRTLESLYLNPLRERAKKNAGHIYPNSPVSITLLIDIKTESAPTYAVLREVLAQYQDILTEFRPTRTTAHAVTAVLSGNRPPKEQLAAEPLRYAAYDGRLSDLDAGTSPKIMPLISQNWSAVSNWKGEAGTTIPEEERKRLQTTIEKVHQQGYRLRFWGTPDTPTTWQAMLDLKVDLINTDDLVGLGEFLTEQKSKSSHGKDALTPAAPGSVRLGGRLGEKMRLCVENRLLAQDIEPVVASYRTKRETGAADWRCEYWGKWFTSLAMVDAYQSTPATREKRDAATRALLATAAPDGYLGTRQPEHRLEGWDVWGRKYALLGLIADYDRTHDAAVLEACRRQTDVLIAELGPGKTNIADVGEWNGLPASSVLEPVVLVYERTGEKKYLDFAEYIIACWNVPSKRLPGGMRLVDDALAGKNPSQMCAPKAYEMMSCFEGLCELYRATGKRDYLDAAIKLAEGIRREEATLIGVGTSNEVWYDGASKQTSAVQKPMETCVTVTWMKYCDQLLRLTGDVRYADELEKNLYNGLLGAMMPDGKWWAYFSGLMGVRVPSYVQHADVGLSCCVVNGPRALMLTPFWAFMQNTEGPVVNLYAPGTAQIGKVKLEVTGDYPVSDHAEIRVTPEKPQEFTLSLRIPAWSERTVLTVNGKSLPATPGYVKIRRTWHRGDRVAITFDMRGRLVKLNEQVALQRGPVVLSLDNRLTPATTGLVTFDPSLSLKPNPVAAKKIGAWMTFDVGGVTFCDYASAGNGFSEQNTYRTWLPQPLNRATVYETGQTWQMLTHETHWTNPPRHVEDTKRDLALAANGASARSDGEYAKEPGSTSQIIDGIIATPEDFSNRWHSSVDVPHPHWIEVHLAKPSKVSRVVIHFADPKGFPVRFEGSVLINGQAHQVFNVTNNQESQVFRLKIKPVTTDTFRLTIHASANPAYPNAAQISEIELYSD